MIDAEVLLDGDLELAPGLRVIHVPGHTRGSCVLLVDDKYLFTGDHLWAWDGRLEMGRSVSWYSWTEQKKSLRKLLDYRFEWVLPGHGRSLHLPEDADARGDGRLRPPPSLSMPARITARDMRARVVRPTKTAIRPGDDDSAFAVRALAKQADRLDRRGRAAKRPPGRGRRRRGRARP